MTPDDKSFFANAMKGVKPLKPSKKITQPKSVSSKIAKPHTKPKRLLAKADSIKAGTPSDYFGLSDPIDDSAMVYPESVLSFGKNHIQHKQFKALRQGKLAIRATLDLHHHTLDDARRKLPQFIHEAALCQKRVVLVIHGKGGYNHGPSRMKSHVNHWLKQIPEVLAFHSATPSHGGYGAVYVLFKAER